MTIARVKKVRLIGLAAEKEAVLRELQELGCLMIVPLGAPGDPQASAPRREVHEALAFLLSCPRRRPQVSNQEGFDAEQVQHRVLDLQETIKDLEDERDALVQRRRDLAPWGEFTFPPSGELGGQKLWFYALPQRQVEQLAAQGLPWRQINKDHANCYMVVLSAEEPF